MENEKRETEKGACPCLAPAEFAPGSEEVCMDGNLCRDGCFRGVSLVPLGLGGDKRAAGWSVRAVSQVALLPTVPFVVRTPGLYLLLNVVKKGEARARPNACARYSVTTDLMCAYVVALERVGAVMGTEGARHVTRQYHQQVAGCLRDFVEQARGESWGAEYREALRSLRRPPVDVSAPREGDMEVVRFLEADAPALSALAEGVHDFTIAYLRLCEDLIMHILGVPEAFKESLHVSGCLDWQDFGDETEKKWEDSQYAYMSCKYEATFMDKTHELLRRGRQDRAWRYAGMSGQSLKELLAIVANPSVTLDSL